MSFNSELVAALSGVAGGRVFPHMADEGAAYPLVNYRILSKSPVVTVDGAIHATQYSVVFECWGRTYATALATADAVRAAIQASALNSYPTDEPGDDYEVQSDSYMEPVYFGFMHA